MAISTQGDVVKYSDGGTLPITAQGVVLTAPGSTAVLGTAAAPLQTQMTSSGGVSNVNAWAYAALTGGIIDTTAVTIKAAAGAGVKNYLSGLQIQNSAAVPSEVIIRMGAAGTVVWRGYVAGPGTLDADFPVPLASAANQLIEVAVVTTGTATRVNAQGYVGA